MKTLHKPMNPAILAEDDKPRPLKVALVGSRGVPATYSGFETFYEQLGVRLAERGHDVTVYNRTHHHPIKQSAYRGMRLVNLPSIATKHLDTISHTLISLLHAIFCRYDVVYICIVGNSPLCIIPKLTGTKVIMNVDGADFEREKWTGFAKTYLKWTERIACWFSDAIIADSTVIQRKYLEQYQKETLFIPYGSNIKDRSVAISDSGVLDRYGLERNGYILFVSRMTPENKAHILIEAYKKLSTDLKLVIVGDAPYTADYQAELRKQCSDNIIMTGYLFGADYEAISAQCLFFVLPAGIDGTRPVLLDQMGFGNCVVVRNTPANMEVVGAAGAWFEDSNDVTSLAARMDKLISDNGEVIEFREKALQRMKGQYSWDAVADQYETLFGRLLTSKALHDGE